MLFQSMEALLGLGDVVWPCLFAGGLLVEEVQEVHIQPLLISGQQGVFAFAALLDDVLIQLG